VAGGGAGAAAGGYRWSYSSMGGSAEGSVVYLPFFRSGLGETDYVEGRNVTVEYHYLEGQFE
jgi:hypothetical protein